MILDNYKELILFHLMFTDEDIHDYSYAAVDGNGDLMVYMREPQISEFNTHLWTDGGLRDDGKYGGYMYLATLPEHVSWKDTLTVINS